jgi:hypothetical protein
MNNIQIKGVESTLSQVVLEDINYLKQHFDDVLKSSDQTLIKNLINETEFLLERAKDDSKTYQERYVVFSQLTEAWFGAYEHYKNYPEATNFIKTIDHLTNYCIAYSYLFLSLSSINEGKTGQYKDDLEEIVRGFLLLCEIVDVFTDYFSVAELKQIYCGAKNAISVSDRDTREYFENSTLSNLVTQLRAYSSLILLKIEEHINNADLTQNDDWLTQDTPEDAVMTVTGELIRIDFDKRIVVLKYPPTHQEIKCIYLEELEDSMIEHRRQKIQVTGQFTLDADGHPIKSTNVTRIEPVDLSPILIREILLHNKKLRFKTPFLLTLQMDDDTEQLYVVEEPEIGLHVFSYTREDLIHEINEQLAMLWEEYAVTTDELATDARTLQAKLLATLEEVDNAAS